MDSLVKPENDSRKPCSKLTGNYQVETIIIIEILHLMDETMSEAGGLEMPATHLPCINQLLRTKL
jgi:hypothetical protein